MELSDHDREIVERLEESLWREETRFDVRRMEGLLAADFFEFGRSGRLYRREETLAIPRGPIDAALPLADFKARLLTAGPRPRHLHQCVTYDGVVLRARRSSIWSRHASGWVLRFHQGTPTPGDA